MNRQRISEQTIGIDSSKAETVGNHSVHCVDRHPHPLYTLQHPALSNRTLPLHSRLYTLYHTTTTTTTPPSKPLTCRFSPGPLHLFNSSPLHSLYFFFHSNPLLLQLFLCTPCHPPTSLSPSLSLCYYCGLSDQEQHLRLFPIKCLSLSSSSCLLLRLLLIHSPYSFFSLLN